jgi:hypothetical protein
MQDIDAMNGIKAETPKVVVLDLATIDTPKTSEEGVELELMYEGKPCGYMVRVRGDHSPTIKKWQLGLGNKFRLKDWQEKRKKQSEQGPALMTEEDVELGLRGAAVRLCGFRNIPFNGQDFPFTPDNAYELVRRYPPFADQILEFSAEIANFSKPQPKV